LIARMVNPDNNILGRAYFDAQLYPLAIDCFIKLDSGEGFEWAGHIYDEYLQDYPKAEFYYLKAAKKGNKLACKGLGRLYSTKIINHGSAKKYFELALDKNYPMSFIQLGVFLLQIGDYTNAEANFKLAVKNGAKEGHVYLGVLYINYLVDYEKAEKNFLIAIENENIEGVNGLAWVYFRKNKFDKKTIQLADQLTQQIQPPAYHAHTAACIFLSAGQLEKALVLGDSFLYDTNLIDNTFDDFTYYLLLLLAKEQYQYLYQFFTSERGTEIQVKDRFKPIWYALMHYMREQYPAEYLRMGEELRETVEEVIRKVESMRAEDQMVPS
jgi:hypothetical protein